MNAAIPLNRHFRLLVVVALALTGFLLPQAGIVQAATGVTVPATHTGHQTSAARSQARQAAAFPLAFEPNRGQTDPRVRFLAHAGGSTIFLTEQGIVVASTRPSKPATSPTHLGPRRISSSPPPSRSAESVVQLLPVGASSHPKIVASNRLPGIVNYIVGRTSHTNIPTYATVRYENVYPGIDLALHGSRTGFEYDWIVRPGADVARIALRVKGTSHLALNANGDLVMKTALGTVTQGHPLLYQVEHGVQHVVTGGFRLGGSVARLWVGRHDDRLPLIVDPTMTLLYSTYLGGGSSDEGFGIAVDGAGDAYVTGDTGSTDFPICPGTGGGHASCSSASGSTVQSSYLGNGDAFVSKLNPGGTQLLYSTYLGGSGGDVGNAIAVDSSGDAYITGYTLSSNFPVCPDNGAGHAYCASHSGGPIQSTYHVSNDAFVAELNPSGTQLNYSTYLGGNGDDVGYGIAVANGNAYVTGSAYSTDFPICPDSGAGNSYCASHTGGPVQKTNAGNFDIFVSEVNGTGTQLLYSTYLGGTGNDQATGSPSMVRETPTSPARPSPPTFPSVRIAVEALPTAHPTTGSPVQKTYGGGTYNGFVSELNPSGTQLNYSTYLGGSNYDFANGIAVNGSGDAFVTGYAGSSNFPVCPDNGAGNSYCASHSGSPLQTTIGGGGQDGFVSELNPSGTQLQYSTFLGGSGEDEGNGIAIDGSSDAYVVGFTTSANYPICPDNGGTSSECASHSGTPPQATAGGGLDGIVSELNPAGTQLVYSTFLGGRARELGEGIAVDGAGSAYVTGLTDSTDFPTCPGSGGGHAACSSSSGSPAQSVYGTNDDAFATKISPAPSGTVSTAISVSVDSVSFTEGTAYSGAIATFSDGTGASCANPPFSASINWGDGTTTAGTISGTNSTSGCTVSGSHTYADESTPTITVTVTNSSTSTTNSGSQGETVTDATLTPTNGSDTTCTINISCSIVVGTFTDANPACPATDYSASINWGDGPGTTTGTITKVSGCTYQVSGSHTYTTSGTKTVTASISDDGGSTAMLSMKVMMIGAITVSVDTIQFTEGSQFSGEVATFSDGTGTSCADPPYTATIDWGDGTTTAGTIGGTNSTSGCTVSGTHTYAEEGNDTITVTVSDSTTSTQMSGSQGESVTDATLTPTNGSNATCTINVSCSITVGTFTDANPACPATDYSATINWGDGTSSTGTITNVSGCTYSVSGSHTYTTAGPHTVTASISDDGGSTAMVSITATVSAPISVSVDSVSFTEGISYSGAIATFSDGTGASCANPPYSASIDWGDGTTTTGTISGTDSTLGCTVSGTHTYADESSPTITVTVSDSSTSETKSGMSGETVADAALTPTNGSNTTCTINMSCSVTVGTFTDANPACPSADYSATIDWGDGTSSTAPLPM